MWGGHFLKTDFHACRNVINFAALSVVMLTFLFVATAEAQTASGVVISSSPTPAPTSSTQPKELEEDNTHYPLRENLDIDRSDTNRFLLTFHADGLTCSSGTQCENAKEGITFTSRKTCKEVKGELSCDVTKSCTGTPQTLPYHGSKRSNKGRIRDDLTRICTADGRQWCKFKEECKEARKAGKSQGRPCNIKRSECKTLGQALNCSSTTTCRIPLLVKAPPNCRSQVFESQKARSNLRILLHLGNSFKQPPSKFQVIVSSDENGEKVFFKESVDIQNGFNSETLFLSLKPRATSTSQITDFWQWMFTRCQQPEAEFKAPSDKLYMTLALDRGDATQPEGVWKAERKKVFAAENLVMAVYQLPPKP